jgi:membrane protein YdbS with pleckstrin-like domain
MNIKALIKTLTPSKEGTIAVLALIAGLLVLLTVAFGITIGLSKLLVYLFGEKITSMIFGATVIAIWVWWLIIEPLVSRYKRIKWEMEHE